MDLKIGCGGWWDFDGGLPSYSRSFDFVELNTSYYRLPKISSARQWRRNVPGGFEFSAKLSRTPPADEQAMMDLLDAMNVRYVVVHLSTSWWEKAVQLLNEGGYVPVLEKRGRRGVATPSLYAPIVTAIDPSTSVHVPGRTEGDTYLRVFGTERGVLHHLSQGMVERVASQVRELNRSGSNRVRVVTHTYQMYDDAERIRQMAREEEDG
jgi:uncharacterized protein YecE (DUF72 family)